MAKAYAHQRDRSMSPSSEEGVAASMLHKRAANGVHANGTGALRAATPDENGCGSGNGNGKDNRHAAVGGARPRPLDVPVLSLWEQYVRANRTHPLQTKCITTGFPSRRSIACPALCATLAWLGAAPTEDAGVSMRSETPWLQPGVLMATGNFGAQLILNL